MKTPSPIAVIVFLLYCLFSFTAAGMSAARVVKVGVYDNKPLAFLDKKETPKGIFIDLLTHVGEKENWELRYIPGSWTECLDRLGAGEIDLLAGIAYSKEREKKYNFTYETVITNWAQIFVQEDSKIISLLDLESKKIAVKMQDIHFYGLRELTTKFNIHCRFIEADRVKAGVVNRLFGLQNKSAYPVKETPIMFNPIEVRYAGPKGSTTDLLATLDVHLRKMQIEKDPFYTQTLKKWMTTPKEWVFPGWAKYSLVAAGLTLFFAICMNVVLRMKVRTRTKELYSANQKLIKEVRTRKKAEDYLRRYERIVAVSADHMALIDRSHAYRALNDAALRAIGIPRDEIVGKKIWSVFNFQGKDDLHKKRMERAFSGQIVKYRSWMDFPMLGRRYMDIVYTPYTVSDGKIAGCVSNYRDITERHELELKLENAQKMEFMGTIAGGVAHDLNNILSGIVSYPDLLLMQLPEESRLVRPIRTIKKSGEKAAVIVQDLLTLARRGVATKQAVDLNKIVTTFLKSPECEKILSFHPTVTIKTDLCDLMSTISGSSVHLSKSVMNLVSNAAEAMPDGGEITIGTRTQYIDSSKVKDTRVSDGNYISLRVSDNGVGISRDDVSKIFEPFYTKKVMGRSGTGLGLAVVWGTVMDHHGFIDVKSDGLAGTQFELFFPIFEDMILPAPDASQQKIRRGNGESILIVDDVEEQRMIASDIVTELGYVVSSVPSGEQAVSKLRGMAFDLVILDMLMPPGMDGLATYEEILKISPGQKTVIASGYAETNRVKKALNLGVGQFIKKPYTIEDVSAAIEKELKGIR